MLTRTLQNFLKLRNIPIRLATQPRYQIFDFFKKKSQPKGSFEKTVSEEKEEDDQEPKNVEEDDNFENKEQYAKKLAQQRLEWEAAREAAQKEAEFLDQRKKREYEVQFNEMDFAKISIQNINIAPVSEFQHLEELFFFIGNLRVKLSEENIGKVIDGFLILAEKITSKDLETAYFKEFIDILENNIPVLSNSELLLKTVKFGDLYCIESKKFWHNFEKKIMAKSSAMPLNEIAHFLHHFSAQKEGSEFFYDRLETLITQKIEGLEYKIIVSVLQSYFRVRRGTTDFIDGLLRVIEKRVDEGSEEDLVKVSQIIKAAKGDYAKLFARIEEKVSPGLEKLDITAICALADGFGFENGSPEFWKKLESFVRKQELNSYGIEKIRLIVKGFFNSYKGSKQLFEDFSSIIIAIKDNLTLAECATIAKAYYIVEIDTNGISAHMQNRIVFELKNTLVTPEDLLEIVKTYTVTRNGSRELYKILEVLIKQRIDELKENVEVLRAIYTYYLTSGLCSAELLKRIEVIL